MRSRHLSWWYLGSDDLRTAIKALNCLHSNFCMREIMYSIQFSSVAQLSLTVCDPMDCSTPGLPVHHQLLELTQTHAHRVSHAIQPSYLCHPLLLPPSIIPSIRIFSVSQFFTSGGQSIRVSASASVSVLPTNIQN